MLPSGTVTFAAGETSKTVTVDVQGNTTVETTEAFLVTLSNPSSGLMLGTTTATGTIVNDDGAVASIMTASANKSEGNSSAPTKGSPGASSTTPFTFTVSLDQAAITSLTVSYSVTGTGANPAAASDFVGGVLPSGSVAFAAGETSKTITVNVKGELTIEATETFLVELSNPSSGVTLGTTTAIGTIVNDDGTSGNNANNTFTGTAANDIFLGLGGDDIIYGGAGDEIAVYNGALNEYAITRLGASFTIADSVAGRDDTDTVTNIEHLQFFDRSLDLTMAAKAATISAGDVNSLIELYVGYFNRVPGAAGLSYWIDKLHGGESLNDISKEFYAASVQYSSVTGYSASMSNADFIKIVYANVLARSGDAAPDAAAVQYWDDQIASGKVTKEGLIQQVLHDAHLFANDPTWGWVPQLLDNKIALGHYHAIQLGIDYNSPDEEISTTVALSAVVTPARIDVAVGLIGLSDTVHLI